MESTCPSCKAKVNHEEYLFEVGCDCGMRFNPFYDAGSENQAAGSTEAPTPSLSNSSVAMFTESQNAFQEIVQFGESLAEKPSAAEIPMTDIIKPNATNSTLSASSNARGASDLPGAMVISGDHLDGFHIDTFFLPVSVCSNVELGAPNPLKAAFETLWKLGESAGGNALLSFRWAFSPDGAKCLLTATPVRATRK